MYRPFIAMWIYLASKEANGHFLLLISVLSAGAWTGIVLAIVAVSLAVILIVRIIIVNVYR